MKRTLKRISLKEIKRPLKPLRNSIEADRLIELADSMRQVGLINPITIKEINGELEIEAGERRYLAAEILGWTEIDCIISEDTDEENLHLQRAHENIIRVDLNPIEEGKICYDLVYQDGRGVEKTATMLAKTPNWVEQRMDILRYPEEIKTAIEEKKITMAVAKELARMKDDEKRNVLLNSAIEFNAGAKQVRMWVDDSHAQEYFEERDNIADREFTSTSEMGETKFECRVCGTYEKISIMRHIWLCPQCLMGVRELAKQVRDDLAKGQAHE